MNKAEYMKNLYKNICQYTNGNSVVMEPNDGSVILNKVSLDDLSNGRCPDDLTVEDLVRFGQLAGIDVYQLFSNED